MIEGHGGDFGEVVADFLNFGAGDFPVKIPFKKCFKIEFFFGGALALRSGFGVANSDAVARRSSVFCNAIILVSFAARHCKSY